METVIASYFKTHFGEVLNRTNRHALRITRRGREAAVLLSETEYHELQRRASRPGAAQAEALRRLQGLATKKPGSPANLAHDPRATAILAKHSPKPDHE